MAPQTILIDTPAKRDRAAKWLSQIPVDEVMELELRPYKQTRSEIQNKRYWKILSLIAEHTGHDKDELHEMFKARFLGSQETEIAGEKIIHQRSSARLTVKDFATFMEQVESWMVSTLGIWLE